MSNRELKIFTGFIKSQWPAFVILCLAAAIFSVINILGKAPSADIDYGLFLLFFLAVCLLFANYVNYRKRVKKLLRECENLSLLHSDLPKAHDYESKCYGDMIDKLHRHVDLTVKKMNEDYVNQIEYYSMWVHQIKTPIAALRLMVQSDANIKDKLAWQTELFKIEQYVSMVLMYLRLSDLAEDMIFQKVDVRSVVNSCVKKYSTVFIYKKLSVSIEDFSMETVSDAKWLAVIIEQFLSNSLKYTPKGTIYFECEKNDDGRQALVIRDEGIGIRREDIPRIFDKGYTGYNGRIFEKSTGIGLYMAKKAADHLGIQFHVTSEVGRGTKVVISMPAGNECSGKTACEALNHKVTGM